MNQHLQSATVRRNQTGAQITPGIVQTSRQNLLIVKYLCDSRNHKIKNYFCFSSISTTWSGRQCQVMIPSHSFVADFHKNEIIFNINTIFMKNIPVMVIMPKGLVRHLSIHPQLPRFGRGRTSQLLQVSILNI